ncbi:MAG: hypothetical protein KAU17_11135 [Spirochaetales bacterium]|nr:hypothetical protein [Spirochaetales bacterium]
MGKKVFLVIVIIILIGGAFYALSSYLVANNKAGYYQIKQAAVSGKMTVRSNPGMYLRLFGDIFTYQEVDMIHFSKSDLEGGAGEEAAPITVRFNDGGTAQISGSLMFSMPTTAEDRLALHNSLKNQENVRFNLVRQVVIEALMQTAALMKAEESYSTRRSEFTALAEEQIRSGIFETVYEERKVLDVEGNEFIEQSVNVKYDDSGNPVVRKVSPLVQYNILIRQFVIKDIDFDETIDALIAKKKEAAQQKVVAEANAERAKQDAITAEMQGKAKIAVAKAEEEVVKIKAVVQAEKEYEVARLNHLRAEEEAQTDLILKQAAAEGARLLVAAGLSPQDKANIEKETAIGVAAEFAKIRFPELMIFGGDGSPMNPLDAMGLEAYLNIINKVKDASEVETE